MVIRVPGYEITKLLGEGGMASVYLATQQSLERAVALKLLNKVDTEAQVKRFFNEGKIIASLNHRNIITIHDLGAVDGRCYLAMEYLEGGDLKHRLDAGIEPNEALKLIRIIATCLDFVHRRGIIHRDIKPENILFRTDGTLVLTDFGVAKHVRTDVALTLDGSAVGSPHYLSPEQAEQKPLDARTDIYSLGIMLYEMLTGVKPFNGASPIEIIVAHLTTEAAPLPKSLAAYQSLVDRMIAKKVEDRFESAAKLVEFVDALPKTKRTTNKKTARILPPPDLSSEPVTDSRKQLPIGWIAALSAGAVVAFFAVYFASFDDKPATVEAPIAEAPAIQKIEPVVDLMLQQRIAALLQEAEALSNKPKPSLSQLQRADALFAEVLAMASDNTDALQGKAHTANSIRNIRNRIKAHLAKAEQAIHSLRLTTPAKDSAIYYFKEALTLDPDNPIAKQGKYRVAGVYADLAEAHLNAFEYDNAKKKIEIGLSLDPTSTRLLALKEQTNAFTDAPVRFFGKMKSIFE
ncbi:MAG: protein kinase domain-containing protein [Gammaproteobacteria bacterium]